MCSYRHCCVWFASKSVMWISVVCRERLTTVHFLHTNGLRPFFCHHSRLFFSRVSHISLVHWIWLQTIDNFHNNNYSLAHKCLRNYSLAPPAIAAYVSHCSSIFPPCYWKFVIILLSISFLRRLKCSIFHTHAYFLFYFTEVMRTKDLVLRFRLTSDCVKIAYTVGILQHSPTECERR